MSLRVRHLYRKAAIYGTLLAACIFFTIGLEILGASWVTIALLFGAIVLAGIAAYLLFDTLALWLFRAKIVDKASEPRAYSIVESLIEHQGLTMPRLAMINDPVVDVFVGSRDRDHAIIFITSGTLNEFNDAEFEAILAHELSIIDEMGSFIYNLVMMAFSALLEAYRMAISSLLFGNARTGGENGEVRIVKARTSDVPAAVRLLIAHGMYNYVYLHYLVGLAKERSPIFLAAYHDGKPVGFILGEIDDPFRRTVHICKFIVDGRYRRKGIGGRLLKAFIDVVESSGCGDCHLEVRMDNDNAISLYEKMDFKRQASIPGYYPDGIDGVRLAKIILKTDR
jgi:ribosomal-protein-alanine N-acetyltransferase